MTKQQANFFLGDCHVIIHFASPGRQKTGFPLDYTKKYCETTFVNFIEGSISISVESAFETLIIEIDIKLYQYSCVDYIKWQKKGRIQAQASKLSFRIAERVYKRQDNTTRTHLM